MNQRWTAGLFLLLGLSLVSRWIGLDSDAPLNAATDMSLTIDASWYPGAALDWATGRQGSTSNNYDPWLYGWAARGAFAIFGPSRWTANWISVMAGLSAIGFTALAARRAYGPAAGWWAGALLSFSYPFFVYSRVAGIYLPAAACSAAILYLEACRVDSMGLKSHLLRLATGAALLAGISGIKPILCLNLLALLTLNWRPRISQRRAWGWKAIFLGVAALLVASACGWQFNFIAPQVYKLRDYLSAGGGILKIPERILVLESRLQLFQLAPLLASLGWVGLLYIPKGPIGRHAAATIGFYLATLGILGYSPLRYFLPAFPAMALLASGALRHLVSGPPAPAAEDLSWRWRMVRFLLSSYCLFQSLQALGNAWGISWADPEAGILPISGGLATAFLAGAALEFHPGWRQWMVRPAPRLIAVVATLLVFGGLELFQGGIALAQAESSISRAGEEVNRIVPPSAHLTGPFAHVLTDETPLRRTFVPLFHFGKGRLEPELRRTGASHFAVELHKDHQKMMRLFQANGVPLRLVHELVIRRKKVHLYRLPWADEISPPSDFERGIFALQAGDPKAAAEHLDRAARRHPDSSAALSALGAALCQIGRKHEAAAQLEKACLMNLYELTARRTLAQLYLERGDLPRAEITLAEIAALDPADAEAVQLLQKIRRH